MTVSREVGSHPTSPGFAPLTRGADTEAYPVNAPHMHPGFVGPPLP